MTSTQSDIHDLEIPPQFLSIEKLERALSDKPENYWKKQGEKRVLALFHAMAKRVPAYRDFLQKHKVRSSTIQTIEDFKKLPLLDKDNYLRAYSLKKLCWDGKFSDHAWTICTTSGSTGEPFYFPHADGQDAQYAVLAEVYLRNNFQIQKNSTLYINGFPMGAWIGGVFTYRAVSIVAARGKYALSVINPGINKVEIIKAVKKLGHEFDQVIIGSYGPFLKDILDDGMRDGIDWKGYNLGFVFSAEGFSESFRDFVLKTAGKENNISATLNHYGTVDLGTMSYETPYAILARRRALENPAFYRSLFDETIRIPTITQYFPNLFYFEEVNRTLVCSAAAGIPLVRYDLKDRGGVYSFNDFSKAFATAGIQLEQEIAKQSSKTPLWRLPIVYVYERNDFSVSFHAFQIYPATIRRALEHASLRTKITGKFTMRVEYHRSHTQRFEINIELKKNVTHLTALRDRVIHIVTAQLLKESSEYRETARMKARGILPHIIFWTYEHERFFRPGIKQKWVLK